MNYLKTSALSLGALVLAASAITLLAPQAAHALAATLVQVTNTVANPAITQGTDKQAGQLLELYCIGLAAPGGNCYQDIPGNYDQPYTPGTQSFVITGVDLIPGTDIGPTACGSAASTTTVFLVESGYVRRTWTMSGPNMAHFSYPSGFVTAPGGTFTSITEGAGSCPIYAFFNGYLTAN